MNISRLNALSDNYIFVIYDSVNHLATVVDPAEAQPVLQKLDELGAPLQAIFNTHHHADHVGGNRQLLQHFPEAVVYGSEEDRGRIPGQSVFLKAGDTVTFAGRTATVMFVPGHTRGHIAYYFPPDEKESDWGELFCGDTLFAGGCGRLFEGTPEQMFDSLGQIRDLPDQTRIWCAHEYTLKNLRFALTVDGQNSELQQRFADVEAACQRQEATVPSSLGKEKRTNPFLRWDDPRLRSAVDGNNSVQTFARLRSQKDRF